MNILSNVLIVPRLSRVQIDMARYGVDEKGLEKIYAKRGNAEQIFFNHMEHMSALDFLEKKFPGSLVSRDDFNESIASKASLVIAAGGDDHFKFISHFLKKTPIFGLNTNPKSSRGELLEKNTDAAVKNLESGKFRIIPETRIDAAINGRPLLPGTCIYALGCANPFGNFRHAVEFKKKKEEHRITSGILVYSGNGSKDWVAGAGRYLGKKIKFFKPAEKKLGWLVRESRADYNLLAGTIGEGEELKVIPLKDNSFISPDAVIEHKEEIQSRDVVIFRVSSTPLMRVRF